MILDKLQDVGFVEFLWSKYQLHLKKVKAQEHLQELVTSMENKTFKPEPDKKLGNSIIKDTPQRQWAIRMKVLRDIEREEKGGFHIQFGEKNINANIQQ